LNWVEASQIPFVTSASRLLTQNRSWQYVHTALDKSINLRGLKVYSMFGKFVSRNLRGHVEVLGENISNL